MMRWQWGVFCFAHRARNVFHSVFIADSARCIRPPGADKNQTADPALQVHALERVCSAAGIEGFEVLGFSICTGGLSL
ncbi:hypothetical protein ROLI_026950 [Roseobacter fucihabitans]|uniref:Secreted protein n=1 Tax=Roseobacter fucihabitans TaxID=1537242 RepID=A0ABZ2BWS4_9RHOB|nr:hypothetical protein [Roseobacter litoralis]